MRTPADLYSARVPRYTSYPTAPHFHERVTQEFYGDWLETLPQAMPLSLYLHVPFCDTLCWFCGCHTTVVNRYEPVSEYFDILLREIEAVAAHVGPGHPVTHIHWGGGSPTMLKPQDILRLRAALQSHFEVTSDAEFAVEIDPRGLKHETVKALAEAGVTRASIGVQDCDIAVQKAINRIQPFAETRSAVERLREAGIARLNIDLVYGLPHQSLQRLAGTVEQTLTLRPQRFAVFGYAHVPHFKKHMRLIAESALPGAEARLEQFDMTHDLLCAAGYEAIGLDHFALPDDGLAVAQRDGRLARNFQGYTDDDAPALIGLGASSIGALPQGYVQNAPDVPKYREAILSGQLATARGKELSDDDRLRRAIIERLMCDMDVDLDAVAAPFGKSAADFRAECAALLPLIAAGFVAMSGPKISVSNRAAMRLVAASFDAYLANANAVHAVAV
jgi:oxygen-independent coproporphyrinogen III oxidase